MKINVKDVIITSEKEYRHALSLIEKLMDAEPDTAEAGILDVLSLVVEKYEEKHFPIPPPDPIDAIKFRMEQLGLTQTDIAKLVGKNRASEILNKKRKLTVEMMKLFHTKLGVPAESLLSV